MRAAPFVLVLALLAALPLAHAQVPATPTCGSISIPSAPAVPAPIAPGTSADVILTVVLTSELAATITATAVVAQPGWSVSTPEPQTVPANGQADITFTVSSTESATEDAIVSFSASGTCQTPQNLPCPGDACNAGSANSQVEVPLQASGGFTFPGLDALGASPEYLIAGLVLIGLAVAIPLAMRRKKSGVVADCPEPLKMVRAGRGTSFPIEIRNASKDPATAQFEVGAVPEGWSAFMPLPEVQLAAREARSLWLMVRSPNEAQVGDAVEVELRLRDPKRASANGSVVKVRAEVQAAGEPAA